MSCSAGALSSPLLTAGRLAVGRRPISSMSSQLTRARQRNVAQQQQRPQQQCRAAAATEKLDAKPMQPDDFMQVCLQIWQCVSRLLQLYTAAADSRRASH